MIDRLIDKRNGCNWNSTRVKCAAHCAAFWQTYRWQFYKACSNARHTRRMINANSFAFLFCLQLNRSYCYCCNCCCFVVACCVLMMIYDCCCSRLAADAASSYVSTRLLIPVEVTSLSTFHVVFESVRFSSAK